MSAARILVFGDSISAAYGIQRTDGWVALLGERLGGPAVINASISGETTGGGRARLATALDTHDPDILVLELGGNDALRGYPLDSIRANLDAMIRLAQSRGIDVLLVGMQIPPNYGPRYANGFTELFDELAARYNLAFVPRFLERVGIDASLMQPDGIHPTAAAQPMLVDAVASVLEPLLLESPDQSNPR